LFHAPANAWIHGDDGFDRTLRHFEQHYFHAVGEALIDVPPGLASVKIVHGMERKIEERGVNVSAGEASSLAVNLGEGAFAVPDAARWVSADVHVHMNYGGNYRNDPAHLDAQAQAEGLGIIHDLIVNKEQRYPDIAYSGRQIDPVSYPAAAAEPRPAIVVHGQEYHTSYWGHLGLLDIAGGIILPGYVGYTNTAAASLYPTNADVADIAHERSALVGYVHPFDDYPEPLEKPQEPLTNELPVDVALGKVDYMEILGFSDHRSTAAVWYRLLNLGYRIPAAAGTDAMANFASLRGPVGMNRVYARLPAGESSVDDSVASWLSALKAGRTFATNGPLLGFRLAGAQIGDDVTMPAATHALRFSAHLRSIVPVDRLELVCNGRPVQALIKAPTDHADIEGAVVPNASGWCLLRASTEKAREEVLDNYVYATTSPIYFTIGAKPPRAPVDARYFEAWMDRLGESVAAYPDWNNPEEKRGVLEKIARAKAIFKAMQ
jgi:hypothetical protein